MMEVLRKKCFIENLTKHVVYNYEKLQVVRTNFELMVSKVLKVCHFQKRDTYDFVGK